MKKPNLLLMVLSPIVIGLVFNRFLVYIPVSIFVAPFILLCYWFWVGTKFAEQVKHPVKAAVAANSMGILSLIVYYWQFIIVADPERNMIFALFSQAFSAPLSYLTAGIGLIFENSPNEITQVTPLVMQASGLILMIVVFIIGYQYKKRLE